MKRRHGLGDCTAAEWAWLTAAADHNPFLGFGGGVLSSPDRLRALWREHDAAIRRFWAKDGEPAELPYGHPATDGPDVAA